MEDDDAFACACSQFRKQCQHSPLPAACYRRRMCTAPCRLPTLHLPRETLLPRKNDENSHFTRVASEHRKKRNAGATLIVVVYDAAVDSAESFGCWCRDIGSSCC